MKPALKNLAHALIVLAAGFTALPVFAASVGEELPTITLKDQSGTQQTLSDSTQRIYANADRKGDALMKEAMADLGQAQLDAQKAVVIADISAAPFFVKSIIRSSLKDRRYLTWLDTSGSTKRVLPYRDNHVTVIEIEQRRIKAIRYIADAGALKREITPVAAVPQP